MRDTARHRTVWGHHWLSRLWLGPVPDLLAVGGLLWGLWVLTDVVLERFPNASLVLLPVAILVLSSSYGAFRLRGAAGGKRLRGRAALLLVLAGLGIGWDWLWALERAGVSVLGPLLALPFLALLLYVFYEFAQWGAWAVSSLRKQWGQPKLPERDQQVPPCPRWALWMGLIVALLVWLNRYIVPPLMWALMGLHDVPR